MTRPESVLNDRRFVELDEVARSTFRDRTYDDQYTMPVENLEYLAEHGWLGVTVSEERGGWGSNIDIGDPAEYLQSIRVVARGCPATAHCYQVQIHSAWTIEGMGSPAQIDEYLQPIIDGECWVPFVGAEPPNDESYDPPTTATPVDGGYVISGSKIFATLAPLAGLVIVRVALDDPSVGDSHESTLFLVDPDDDRVSMEHDWWRPTGMEGAVSSKVHFDDVFVREEDMLGTPGEYPRDWVGKYQAAFPANYLGAMEGVYDFYRGYLVDHGIAQFDSVKLRTGEIRSRIRATEAFFHDVVRTLQDDSLSPAAQERTARQAKHFAGRTVLDVGSKVAETAGASAMFAEYPIGRHLKDMHMHTHHAHFDIDAIQLGEAELRRVDD